LLHVCPANALLCSQSQGVLLQLLLLLLLRLLQLLLLVLQFVTE
jgi:hypothetical protein